MTAEILNVTNPDEPQGIVGVVLLSGQIALQPGVDEGSLCNMAVTASFVSWALGNGLMTGR